ncbi:RNase E specificity factor CsrD [Salmonella enterica subsp. enterica serovar Choleraesuis]|nr:RNase E specificity factor CsrD [Salmonella enterica subsp. enterica serovar Choleraesuis]
MNSVALLLDNALVSHTPETLASRMDEVMLPLDITQISLYAGDSLLQQYDRPSGYQQSGNQYQFHDLSLELMKNPGFRVQLTYRDPIASYYQTLFTTTPLSVAILVIACCVFLVIRWVKRQLSGKELLESRAIRILNGERGPGVRGDMREWPVRASSALDLLLMELEHADERRGRIDTLIRAHAAQDARTGLSNRLFFDNQLATLLEDPERVGTHGVVMMIRLPDFDILRESWGNSVVEEYLFTIVNLLSTFITRYPGALLARYFRSDFAVLLPHRTLKEADGIASALLTAVDALPPTRMLDRNDMIHIGICGWRGEQSPDQVMENVEEATRNAALQGGNNWAVYDEVLPERGRGNVRWRTLLEQALQRGGPRFYQKPAIEISGRVHHREIMCRIFDGNEEVTAAEYMPMVQQFGLAESYDRQSITRLLPLLSFWPEESLAIQITVDALLRKPFQRWLRDTLMQSEKSIRKRILFELPEADVCQHIGRLRGVIRLFRALGVRVVIIHAGLTVVSTTYIKDLDIELIKLHPGLIRSINKRPENQLFVRSLVEACSGTKARVFATGVRQREEWQTLREIGVAGVQGDLFEGSQPLDTSVKKYSQRYTV